VASGKGGTGKTTVAVNLARVAATNGTAAEPTAKHGPCVQLLDCDVEEPNAHLFLRGVMAHAEVVTQPVPEVDAARCIGCGTCGRVCEFHAIVSIGGKALVFPEMCHGCGACALACPRNAIREVAHRIGEVERFDVDGIALLHGRLDVGAAMAPPLIRAVQARALPDTLTILDAPPGTSCPVIAAVRGAHFVLLVTEPTPFGLHDLRLAIDMIRETGVPHGVLVNRAGIGDDRVQAYCETEGVPLLGEIPDDRRIAEAYSRGEVLVEALPEYRSVFKDLLGRIRNQVARHG
jgi:MinD superfamily P-loop ATPase